jgi:hypothetical protein
MLGGSDQYLCLQSYTTIVPILTRNKLSKDDVHEWQCGTCSDGGNNRYSVQAATVVIGVCEDPLQSCMSVRTIECEQQAANPHTVLLTHLFVALQNQHTM